MDIRFDPVKTGNEVQGRGEKAPAFDLGSRLQGKVIEVNGQTARIQFGGTILEAKIQVPLSVGDALLLTVVAKDASGILLKVVPPQNPVPGTLTDDDLGAILNGWNLPKGGMEAAQALIRRSGMLGQSELKEFIAQSKGVEDLDTAAFLFTKGLPISLDTLEWAKGKEDFPLQGLAEKTDKLAKSVKSANSSEQEAQKEVRTLGDLIDRFRFDPRGGAKALLENLRSPESVLLKFLHASKDEETPMGLEENATLQLQVLADKGGPVGNLAADLLSAMRFSQLVSTVRPEVPFLLEDGEGRIESEGEKVTLDLNFDRLGRLRVEMIQIEGRLSLLVLADEPETAQWLSERLDSLREGLESKGYRPKMLVRRKPLVLSEAPQGRVDLRL
ncbi:MAG TPA: hypothetical protein DD435_00190 [Cyanobacteria bacterium UBA8530]|nr:hypothetical protein [Cyanobacteria bacterium UBA8530]